jgi:hypothetical protein
MLVRIRENEHWLLRVSHHIISDAWSWKVYFRELALVYEAKWRDQAVPLPEFEPLQYCDYAAQQRHIIHQEETAYQEMLAWSGTLFCRKLRSPKMPL